VPVGEPVSAAVPEAVPEALVEAPESPELPVSALLGSRVPQLSLISVVHASWAFLSEAFSEMQSSKACSQTNCTRLC